MSDGESTTPAPRKRPNYGLPGPTSPAPGTDPTYGSPSYGAPSVGEPGADPSVGAYGAPSPYGQYEQYGQYGQYGAQAAPGAVAHDPYAPQSGPLPSSGGLGPAPRRRRGLWPLLIGLVLLLVIAPAATIGGIAWSVGSLVGDTSSGPIPLEGATGEVEAPANQMLIVYVPQADADAAECTAEGAQPGAVSAVPSSTAITFGDGSQYVQALGVATLEDTTVTISCTGTEEAGYLGPYSLFGMAGPLLIGPIIGVVAGLIGLVLTIVGIVLLVRSRRS